MNLKILTRGGISYGITDAFGEKIAFTRGDVALNLDIVEKSFTSGAVLIGERRLASKEMAISGELFNETDTDFRQQYNDFLYYCSQAEYIEDTDNNIRTKVEFIGFTDSPYQTLGTVNRGGFVDVRFRQLTPYWEDLTEIQSSVSGSDILTQINNTGSLETPARFEIAVTSLCDLIQIFITNPVRGIEVRDLAFGGSTELDDYVIDNLTGEVLLGDTELNRNDRIQNGSGFFDFPVGSFNLNLKFTVSASVTIAYRRRFFI